MSGRQFFSNGKGLADPTCEDPTANPGQT